MVSEYEAIYYTYPTYTFNNTDSQIKFDPQPYQEDCIYKKNYEGLYGETPKRK